MGISRRTAAKWWGRWLLEGNDGLAEASSRPVNSPTAIPDNVVELILAVRADKKWGAQRISAHLRDQYGVEVSGSTVHRTLQRHDVNRLSDLDRPDGGSKREVKRFDFPNPGDMIHVDVKKAGRIPDGGGWFVHGMGTDLTRQSKRKGTGRVGYIYIHSAVDAHTRMAYSEVHLNEKGATAADFWRRAVAFFRRYGFDNFERCMTDNGSAYRSAAFNDALDQSGTKHRFTPPYTPRVNGKVERFNRILKEEWLHVTGYDSEYQRIEALATFLNYYNLERAHSAVGYRAPVTRAPGGNYVLPPQPLEWAPMPKTGPRTEQQAWDFEETTS